MTSEVIAGRIDDLDRFVRTPRLIDVALDGPRSPSALRLLSGTTPPEAPDWMARRICPPEDMATGRWEPAGDHMVETYKMLLEVWEEHGPAAEAPEPVRSAVVPEPIAPLEVEELIEPRVEPTDETLAAQLQSLNDELTALRGELAAAKDAEAQTARHRDELERERDVLRQKREDLLQQLTTAKQRRRDAEGELAEVRDRLTELQARLEAAASTQLDVDRLDRIARAAMSIARRETLTEADLFVVERLHSAVPEDQRVAQAHGLVLSRLGDHDQALEVFRPIDRSKLSRASVLALVRGAVAVGVPLDDIGPLVMSLRPSMDEVRSLAELTGALPSGRVLELTRELLAVVPDEEMAGWFTAVTGRLTGRPLVGVLQLWAAIEPEPALRALLAAVADERLTMNDADAAGLALELDWLSLSDDEARDLAQRLAGSSARKRDVARLYRLLEKVDHLAAADRHTIGTDLIQTIAQIEPDRSSISPALELAARFVEDHRQANRLPDAVRLAGFVRQNLHRAHADTQAYAELVLADLERAVANSAIAQRIEEEFDRESLSDVKRAVAGKRFLFVGGQRQEWYEELRQQLGFSSDSEWRESSRGEPPSMHQLRAIVRAQRIDAIFVFTDFVAHKTSAIKEDAQQYGVPYVDAKMSKLGMIEALRTWMRSTEAASVR